MKREAQTVLEYTVLFAVIAAALFAMQIYIKRGVQGRLKDSAQQLSEGAFYSPGATWSYSEARNIIEENSDSENKTTTSQVKAEQQTVKREEILPFSMEPGRW